MIRFAILFTILFVITLAMLAGIAAQYGYTLIDPRMQAIWVAAILVAAYVAWRINGVLKQRERRADPDGSQSGGIFGGLFVPGKSDTQRAREARIAARREKLIAEGKLAPEPEIDTSEADEVPTRVPQSASLEERMAARRERVRRAKEEGR